MKSGRQLHTYYYFIDTDGEWWCGDNRVADPDLKRLLSRSLRFDGRGHWVRCEGETHPVVVADAAVRISRVELKTGFQGLTGVTLILEDGRQRPLGNELWVSTDNALYTRLPGSGLSARFLRQPFYDLTAHLDQEGEMFFLTVAGRKVPIAAPSAR